MPFLVSSRFHCNAVGCKGWISTRCLTTMGPSTVMAEKGQVLTHCLHPTHLASSAITVHVPESTVRAFFGHRMTHSWHPAHRSTRTVMCGPWEPFFDSGLVAIFCATDCSFNLLRSSSRRACWQEHHTRVQEQAQQPE